MKNQTNVNYNQQKLPVCWKANVLKDEKHHLNQVSTIVVTCGSFISCVSGCLSCMAL